MELEACTFVQMAIPLIRMAGVDQKNKDENTSGKDDLIGTSLVYAADLLDWIVNDKKQPVVPEALKAAK